MQNIYGVIAQSADEVQDTDNSPSVSMWPYLLHSAQTQLLNQISIYAETGDSRERVRLLYMNATALQIWKAMGKSTTTVDETRRPPRAAQLAFGMPFSE